MFARLSYEASLLPVGQTTHIRDLGNQVPVAVAGLLRLDAEGLPSPQTQAHETSTSSGSPARHRHGRPGGDRRRTGDGSEHPGRQTAPDDPDLSMRCAAQHLNTQDRGY